MADEKLIQEIGEGKKEDKRGGGQRKRGKEGKGRERRGGDGRKNGRSRPTVFVLICESVLHEKPTLL